MEGISTAGVASFILHRVVDLDIVQLLVGAAAEALLRGAQVLVRMRQKVRRKWLPGPIALRNLARPEVLLLLWTKRVRDVVIHCVVRLNRVTRRLRKLPIFRAVVVVELTGSLTA